MSQNTMVAGSDSYSIMGSDGRNGYKGLASENASTGKGNSMEGLYVNDTDVDIPLKKALGYTGYQSNIPPYIAFNIWHRIE